MLKVFGFVRRNQRLTHDEYRAGHVGYHNSFGRRLNGIRGYLLNVRANAPIQASLGAAHEHITRNEPEAFDAQWDGWGQLLFDSLDAYLAARSPARDRAGPGGLTDDPGVAGVGGDFDHLYSGSPFQFHVREHVGVAVRRPERKLFKLAQFVKRREGLNEDLFWAYLTGRYAQHAATVPGLRGLIVNLRTPLDVMQGFFAADSEGFTEAGVRRRETFYAGWDAIVEYWLDDAAMFAEHRLRGPAADTLAALDAELFDATFYREVDETVAVMPNRAPAPAFYHR